MTERLPTAQPLAQTPAQLTASQSLAADGLTNAGGVRAFHAAMGLAQPERPTVPDAALLALRLTLIREEVAEVEEAAAALGRLGSSAAPADLTPLAHELTDLLYVSYGALLALGVDPDRAFAEIQRANMSKAGGPRRADGKVLKPEGWQPADLRGLIGHLGQEAPHREA